jgi:hypothetical protein
MGLSKLGTMVAILATAAGFSALADTAHAQISGTIGGDLVDNDPQQLLCDPRVTLADGNVVIEAGRDSDQHLTLRHCGGWPLANVASPRRNIAARAASS